MNPTESRELTWTNPTAATVSLPMTIVVQPYYGASCLSQKWTIDVCVLYRVYETFVCGPTTACRITSEQKSYRIVRTSTAIVSWSTLPSC
jgi:hypothetical protein